MSQRGKIKSIKTLRLILFSFVAFIVIASLTKSNGGSSLSLRGSSSDEFIWVKPDAQNFDESNLVHDANHLILVAGHSVIVSGHLQDAGTDEKDWYLLDYQKGRGLPQAILAHIQEGINIASQDRRSLLIFSGGETRPATGPINEGSSYFHVADAMKLWSVPQELSNSLDKDATSTVRARTVAEEFATDSFQNL